MANTPTLLAGKSALITGAGNGIGLACAHVFARAGAKVVLADINFAAAESGAKQIQESGMSALAVACDVSKGLSGAWASRDVVLSITWCGHLQSSSLQSESCANAVATAVNEYGKLDILVANAGIVRAGSFLTMSEENWDTTIDVNLKGVFLSSQHAARQMVEQKTGGSIVTMSSVNANHTIAAITPYVASKGGISSLTKAMALSLADHNIRVNGVAPGSIMTDVLKTVLDQDKEQFRRILSRTPMLRIGKPEEIANTALFLASDLSSYITGEIITVDGGRCAMNYTVSVPDELLSDDK